MKENYATVYPFHFYSKTGNLDGILKLGINLNKEHWVNIINQFDNRGLTVLHLAMEVGSLDLVKFLVEKGADIHKEVVGNDATGWNSLHFAAFDNRTEIIKYLVSAGADVNKVSVAGRWLPLKVAITRGWVDSSLLLINLGSNVLGEDDKGFTLLHEAVNLGLYDVIKALIGKGADVNARAKNGSTPIDWAVMRNDKKTIKFLIEAGE